MALASLSDQLPSSLASPSSAGSARPGLSARVSSLWSDVQSLVADLDPGLLVGADAVSLYRDLGQVERLVGAAKTLLAARIDTSGVWSEGGHRSAAGLLADLDGKDSAGLLRLSTNSGHLDGVLERAPHHAIGDQPVHQGASRVRVHALTPQAQWP